MLPVGRAKSGGFDGMDYVAPDRGGWWRLDKEDLAYPRKTVSIMPVLLKINYIKQHGPFLVPIVLKFT